MEYLETLDGYRSSSSISQEYYQNNHVMLDKHHVIVFGKILCWYL